MKTNPIEMEAAYNEAFFYNRGMEIAMGVLYLALNYLVAAHPAYQFTEVGGWATDNDILRITVPIVRAGGRLVTLNCAVSKCSVMNESSLVRNFTQRANLNFRVESGNSTRNVSPGLLSEYCMRAILCSFLQLIVLNFNLALQLSDTIYSESPSPVNLSLRIRVSTMDHLFVQQTPQSSSYI
jgi:hypothetical protein